MSASEGIKSNRIHGFDIWRSCLLAFGPLVHSAMIVFPEGGALYYGIAFSSNIFRMEVFFTLSGVVSFFAFTKDTNWIYRRTLQLLIPTIVVYLFAMPLWWYSTNTPMFDISDVQHLWFLISLTLSTLLVIAARKIGVMQYVLGLFSRIDIRLTIPLIIISALAGRLIFRGGMWALNFDTGLATATILQTIYYGQFYVLGWIFGEAENFRKKVSVARVIRPAAIIYGLFILLFIVMPGVWLPDSDRSTLTKLIAAGSPAIVGIMMSLAALKTSINFRGHTPPLLNKFRECAFSVYLLHMPIVGFIWMLTNTYPTFIVFILCSVGSLFASILIHFTIIKNNWLMELLINGNIPNSFIPRIRPKIALK